jgi:hypothetical protein
MYIALAAAQSGPLGIISRALRPSLDRTQRLCFYRVAGEPAALLLDCEAHVLTRTNEFLARRRSSLRLLRCLPHKKKQHFVEVSWVEMSEEGWFEHPPVLINLYEPSSRKDRQDENVSASDVDTETAERVTN